MAELIDKKSALNALSSASYGNFNYVTARNAIDCVPTTTEAEIRAKALGVMGMALKEVYPTHKANYVEFDVFFRDVMLIVAEQLKEK